MSAESQSQSAKPTYTYKLYSYRDRGGALFYRAKYQWGPFWRWVNQGRWLFDMYVQRVAEWEDKDSAIKQIQEHADSRRNNEESAKVFVIIEKIQA